MEAREIYGKLERQFPGKVSGFRGDVFDPDLKVESQSIVDVCRYLRDDAVAERGRHVVEQRLR